MELSAQGLADWIQDAAHGKVPDPHRDSTAWDEFYGNYRSATPERKSLVDQVFESLAASPDPAVRAAVVTHWYSADRRVACAALERMLLNHADLYADQKSSDSPRSLRFQLLSALAERAVGPEARDLILGALPANEELPASIGTYLGHLGLEAVQELVAIRGTPDAAKAIRDAGYELHRQPELWAEARRRMVRWPLSLQQALVQGATDHAARFGGAVGEEPQAAPGETTP